MQGEQNKMKIRSETINRITIYGGFVQILLLLIVLWGCDFGTPDYKLNVTLEEGVTGTPGPGEHLYKDLSEVSYEYTAIDPIHTVEVFLNGIRQTDTGTFTMYTHVELTARLVDIRGSWRVDMVQTDTTETLEFDLALDGAGLTNGTFSDSRGYNGTWTAVDGVVTISYTDWSGYVLSGTVYDMSGTYTVDGVSMGVWSAESIE